MNTGLELTGKGEDVVFKVYPNPFIDQIKIEFVEGISGEVDIHLTTIEGKSVKTINYFLSGEKLIEFPINGLAKGPYFLYACSEEKYCNVRLIFCQ